MKKTTCSWLLLLVALAMPMLLISQSALLKSVYTEGSIFPNSTYRTTTLMYDDGVNDDAIGLTNGGTFEVSAYWPSADMSPYTGEYLNEVEIYINDTTSDFTIKIYDAGTSTSPGSLLHSEAVILVDTGWMTVTLTTPVLISGADIWIGYEVSNQPIGTYPAGCDAGPAVAGYGDMISMDGTSWESLSTAYSLDYNWNIHAFINPASSGCQYQVALYDTYGDGWNGGSLDVFVDGSIVLDDITLASGFGPEYFSFPVSDGSDITTVYTGGGWSNENWYEFYNNIGDTVYTAANESIQSGTLYALCAIGDPEINVDPTSLTINQSTTSSKSINNFDENVSLDEKLMGEYKSGQLLVKFKDDTKIDKVNKILSNNKCSSIRSYHIVSNMFLVKINDGVDVPTKARQLQLVDEIIYAEPDQIVHKVQTIPNDQGFGGLYGMHNTGQNGGTVDADIDAPEAWDIETGDGTVVVGIIDSGMDYDHPDLLDNVWTNTGEIQNNGIDDDGNGYIDDIHGWDWAYGDNDPSDYDGHGTHCSGIVGAVGNNSIGVAGVCWDVKMMALKFLDDQGSGYSSNAISAIEYAADNGAALTSNSWGGGSYSSSLRTAILNSNMIFAVAAGNGGADGIGDDNDITPFYPSSYDCDNIIAVASLDRYNSRSGFSNYGATSVDLGAYGSSILSTKPDNATDITFGAPGQGLSSSYYGIISGTSMATPQVAGLAALIYSNDPLMTWQDVKNQIMNNVEPVTALSGITVTGGCINAFNSLSGSQNSNLFNIQNIGNADLSITSVSSDQAWLTSSGYPTTPFTIAPNSSQVVNLDVDWTQLNTTQTANVTIVSDDSDEPSVIVAVTAVPAQSTSLQPPTNLQASVIGSDVQLTWDAPSSSCTNEWIQWDDGVNNDGIGLTNGGDWSLSVRWDTAQLVNYSGAEITKVKVFIADTSFSQAEIKIWKGVNASTLLYSQVISNPVESDWNEILISPGISIDISEELWVGYSITGQEAGNWVAGLDGGPAEVGYGDKFTLDGGSTWDNLSNMGFDGNWNIAAYVEDTCGTSGNYVRTPKPVHNCQANFSPFAYSSNGNVNLNEQAIPLRNLISGTNNDKSERRKLIIASAEGSPGAAPYVAGEPGTQQSLSNIIQPQDVSVQIYGIDNSTSEYSWFLSDSPGTLDTIAPWPDSDFPNASEIKVGTSDVMYSVDYGNGDTYETNLTTGAVSTIGNLGIIEITGMCIDYYDDSYYIVDWSGNFYSFDPEIPSATLIGNTGFGGLIAVTGAGNYNIYAYSVTTDEFIQIDPLTGLGTLIGPIGFNANYGQGMAYDQTNDVVYMSAYNNDDNQAELRSVDISTGNTTLIGPIGTPGVTQFGTICLPYQSDSNVLGYNVYRDNSILSFTTTTSYLDQGVPDGTYDYYVTAVYAAGESIPSDTIPVTVGSTGSSRTKVLVEFGTATWSVFDPGASMGADDLLANNDPVAIIKYQQGEFENTASLNRISYYGIIGFPTAQFDGSYNQYVGGNATTSMYSSYLPIVNSRMTIPADFSLNITGTQTGDNVSLNVELTKDNTYSGTNLMLRVALTESSIPYTWFNMTEVNNVERIMIPDDVGTVVSFSSGNTVQVPLSFVFDSTWDINNCELVAFLQDDDTKEVLHCTSIEMTSLSPGSGNHFTPIWSGYPYQPMNILLSSATLDGVDLQVGDEVGVFDVDGSGNDICVGTEVITAPASPGSPLSITVSADDPNTSDIDGFTTGNTIIYRAWSASDQAEYANYIATYNPAFDTDFNPLGTALVDVEFLSSVTQTIELNTGWNIMSFYVQPPDMGMLNILQPLVDSSELVKVINEAGGFIQFIPGVGWMNTIGDMANTEGYYIKVNANTTLDATGSIVTLPYDITLNTGWNIMGYPADQGQDAITVLQPLINSGHLTKVIDEAGGFIQYIPGVGWMNTIGNFEPGEGYYIKLNTNDTLTINENGSKSLTQNTTIKEGQYYQRQSKGNPYMPMHIVASFDNIELEAGDEFGVFANEVCIGSAEITDPTKPIVTFLSTDDPTTVNIDGGVAGEALTFKLLHRGREYMLITEEQIQYDPLETRVIKFTATGLELDENSENTFSVSEVIPNPFSSEARVYVNIPDEGNLKVDLLDLRGSIISTIYNQEAKPGKLEIKIEANDLKQGMYFVQVRYQNDKKRDDVLRKAVVTLR